MTRQQPPEEMHAAIVVIATDDHRLLYEDTGNPLHAWAAIVQARQLRARDLPAWIMQYLDEVAARLMAPNSTASPQAIADAMGLRTRRGGPSARTRAITAKRAAAVRQRVALQRRAGKTVTDAIGDVADAVGLSTERVHEILYRRPADTRTRRKVGKPRK